ncbi:TolC family protein [Aliifodinibius sp. S!AR15-10]|uniref:TolC family protein n=1 Tax=Aliifodinibius sp. S!AR15-10 TaxID=2950437 RepID=UPI0028628984|nr:TolC family protein [Aliifodinibius sp. S!AR15-10]MDR8390470.1 TolC family protein [Aliifodinibius sp. S!AR15-10]
MKLLPQTTNPSTRVSEYISSGLLWPVVLDRVGSRLMVQITAGLIFFLLVTSAKVHAQQDTTATQLDHYLQEAARNNPELQALVYKYRSILEQAPQVGTLPDPEVMFMYFANPRNYSSPLSRMTLSASQWFSWFGTLNTAEKRVQSLARAQLDEVINTRNRLFRDIKEVRFQMYEINHHIKVFRENLELLSMLESTVDIIYETGEASQVDLIRLQIEKDKIRTRIEQMEDRLVPHQIEFNTLLNRDPQAAIDMPMPMETNTLGLSPDKILAKIQAQNPRLSRLDYNKQAAEYALEGARLSGLPSFGVGVEAMLPNFMYMPLMPGERTALVAKLSVKVPLYRNKYNAQQREARLDIRSIQAQQTDVRGRLYADAEKRLQQYRDAQYRINLYEDQLMPKTRRALEIAIEAYSTEVGNFEELIQLQRQILDYEMGLNTAYVERNIAVAELEYLYGKYNVSPEEIEPSN